MLRRLRGILRWGSEWIAVANGHMSEYDNSDRWIASKPLRLPAPLLGSADPTSYIPTAHTSARHIVAGIHTPTEPFEGTLFRRHRHE
jgi:hypothetical protein